MKSRFDSKMLQAEVSRLCPGAVVAVLRTNGWLSLTLDFNGRQSSVETDAKEAETDLPSFSEKFVKPALAVLQQRLDRSV